MTIEAAGMTIIGAPSNLTTEGPCPLGSRPRFLGGRLFAGMTIEPVGMTETKEGGKSVV